MKKLALLLLALAIVAPLFADDAKVLPAGVLRTYVVVANQTWDETYDKDGELEDTATGKSSVFNVGGALEFGVTEQISAALQWAPGYNVSTDFEDLEDANVNGFQDLFIGAKGQILGPNGFVPNETMRFAAALGVMVPLQNTDWEAEIEKQFKGDEYNLGSGSKEVLGYGFRLYYDYIINDMFYVNLYNESIFYPEQAASNATTAVTQATIAALGGSPTPWTAIEDVDINYGYDLTFEVEPHFDYPLSPTLDLGIGVPVTYTLSPNVEYDGEEAEDTESNLLRVSPSASFFLKAPLPLEFKLGYGIPLSGQTADASSLLVFQIKSYLKFY